LNAAPFENGQRAEVSKIFIASAKMNGVIRSLGWLLFFPVSPLGRCGAWVS
jgi:hypothetical protein